MLNTMAPMLKFSLCLTALLLCITLSCATDEAATHANNHTNFNTSANFNCLEDCHCVLAQHTHKPFLHAKCSGIAGLKSEAPLQATLPIHSIDLSYLNLTRLSHALEKLRDVVSIDLSHNELHEIGHLGRRIKKLNLKHNHITSGKLAKLPQHVEVLNLQHNDITYLPLEFTKLMHLHTLELSHNQINCSCDTLEVRNWLQDRHVFMESPVKCVLPAEVKGQSWLQVKKADVCEKEKRGWYADEDENELMMGDQPIEGSADKQNDDEEEEELGKDFMPVTHATSKSSELNNDIEGSGDLSEMNMPVKLAPAITVSTHAHEQLATEVPMEQLDEDGSGSGDGMLILPHLHSEPVNTDDFETPDEESDRSFHHDNDNDTDNDDDFDDKPVEQPEAETKRAEDIFGNGLGIYGNATEEPVIVPVVVHHNVDAAGETITDAPLQDGDEDKAAVMHAKVGESDDSNATYLLLGVIALIVVGLILFVGIKRCKHNNNAAHDAENPRQTELMDMDKKQLGKPLHRNGHEHAPLIGDKTKADLAKPTNGAGGKRPYDANDIKDGPGQQLPLIKEDSNGSTLNESNNNENQLAPEHLATNEQAPHEYYPITPRYPTPKSPRASKYAQYPQEGSEFNNNNVGEAYALPSSPKSGRYSPVYSPETGRVKIKLTETPKPKTPMLVTRSKSNAGDIITTPVHVTHLEHVPAVNGH